MDVHAQQAYADFEKFLDGSRAPALVARSLKAVVHRDVRETARAVVAWAHARGGADPVGALMAARSKVFDIFFYRVVPFSRVHGYFGGFEEAVLAELPPAARAAAEARFRREPWQGLRPWPVVDEMRELALERRAAPTVEAEAFNEDVYKNATHQLLNADKRYDFADERTRGSITKVQERVADVLGDFVSLIADPDSKREILLANTADRDVDYASRETFSVDAYACHLADFAVALFNDGYPEHSVRVFAIIESLGVDHGHDFASNAGFQAKAALFNRQKLGEYAATRTGAVLLRGALPLFSRWHPDVLLGEILREEDRRERKIALALLEAYGPDAFDAVVATLEACGEVTPWYYVRNMAHLLGRMTSPDAAGRARAVAALSRFLGPEQTRQVSREVVSALAAYGDEATGALASRLAQLAPLADRKREAHEVCHRIVPALIAMGSPAAVSAAFEFCFRHGFVGQYAEALGSVELPEDARERLVAKVRKSARRLRLSFALLGDAASARAHLAALGHARHAAVAALCRELSEAFPADHPLAAEAARLLAARPPAASLARDRALHRFLALKDLAQAACHMYDAGTTGVLEAATRDDLEFEVVFDGGAVTHAAIPAYETEGDEALLSVLLLDPKDIATLGFAEGAAPGRQRTVTRPTYDLLRDAIFQRNEVQQITDRVIAPDARFRRREAHPFFLHLEQIDEPLKYEAVWEALAEENDLRGIRSATRLSRHDIYRILFYFVRRDAIEIAGEAQGGGAGGVDDAVAALGRRVQRIAARPLYFQAYAAAAESARFVEQNVGDPTLASAAAALRAFLADAHAHRRALAREGVDLCAEAASLIIECRRTRSRDDYRRLADLVAFSFATAPPPVAGPSADAPTSELERLENIENLEGGERIFGEDAVDELFDSLDRVLTSGRATGGLPSGRLDAGLTPSEEAMLLELFGNIANAYVQPFKDFVRELDRNHKAKSPTSSDWLEFVEPSVRLMSGASEKMGYAKIHTIMARVEGLIAARRAAGEDVLPRLFCEQILVEHHKLSKVLPGTFALALAPEELAAKKDGLLVRFILRQVAGVDDRVMNKILFAGLNSFERFAHTPPEEIAHVTGIEPALADRIFMKFYQYQDLYFDPGAPEKRRKAAQMFDIGLQILREIHTEVDRLARALAAGDEVDLERKAALEEDRQRTLMSLYILLCIRGDHDVVERLQLSVFGDRLRVLGEYYAVLAADEAVGTAASTGSGRL